jgi:branched-chain amino acid transport system permease protein
MRRAGLFFWIGASVAAILIALPFVGTSSYDITLVTQMMILGIAAMGLDLLVGYTGMISFAQATFFGVAAYGIAVGTTELGIFNFFAVSAFAVAISVALAAMLGLLALRASGVGFIIITLALNELVWGLAYQWVSVSGGDNGITGFLRPTLLGVDFGGINSFYYLSLFVLAACAWLLYLVVHSPFGLALRGIREQPRRMRALGYNVWLHQYIAFIVAAFFAAVAGVLIAYYNEFVGTTMINLAQSTQLLIMTILGGTGTLFGSLLGSGIIVTLSNLISNYTQRWELILGAIYVIIVMFAPEGILGLLQRVLSHRSPGIGSARREVMSVLRRKGRAPPEGGRGIEAVEQDSSGPGNGQL